MQTLVFVAPVVLRKDAQTEKSQRNAQSEETETRAHAPLWKSCRHWKLPQGAEPINLAENIAGDIFCARVVDVTARSYTMELSGSSEKLDAWLEALGRGNILETVRTGLSALWRGEKPLLHSQPVKQRASELEETL